MATDLDLMSQRAYGARRGVSHTAVQRAISSGRLSASVHRRENGRFLGLDPELADSEWAQHTDPTKPTGKVPEDQIFPDDPQQNLPGIAREPPKARALGPPAPQDPETLSARKQGVVATSVRQAFAAKLAELEFREKAGELVPVAEIRERLESVARQVRDLILAIPPRIAPDLAAVETEAEARILLEDELRQALAGLAQELATSAAARNAS